MFSLIFVVFAFVDPGNSISISPNKLTGIGFSCSDRRWANYNDTISTERRQLVEQVKISPLPVFNDTIYLEGVYNRDKSDRMLTNLYENLSSLVLVECIEYKGEFIQTIEDYLNNIVSAKSWASVGNDPNFDYFYGRVYWLEEYSVIIGNTLSQVLYMFSEKISDFTKNNCLNAIDKRMIQPMDRHFAGDPDILRRHWWKDSPENMNVVCWGAVARIALSTITNQTKRDDYVDAALIGAQYSWGAWRSDGFMGEGGNYYNYDLMHAIFFRQHVMEASEGKNDFFTIHPNTDQMLAFGFEYPMNGTKCAFFSDDGDGTINSDIRNYIQMLYTSDLKNKEVFIDWSTVGLALRFSLDINPNNIYQIENNRTFEVGIRKYYNESAVLICRPNRVDGLAASFKLLGGGADSTGDHNHDDAGTYNVMKNNTNIVGDVGGGDYEVTWINRFTESEIYGSYSHPLPIIDGMNQTRNMNYYYFKNVTLPTVICTSFTNDSDEIVFNLTSLYPVSSLVFLIRSNLYTRIIGNESVVIEDKVLFSSPTNYQFGIGSRNGVWKESSVSSNSIAGTFTVESTSINVRVKSSNPFQYEPITKTINSVTYTRLKILMINPIITDTVTVTYE